MNETKSGSISTNRRRKRHPVATRFTELRYARGCDLLLEYARWLMQRSFYRDISADVKACWEPLPNLPRACRDTAPPGLRQRSRHRAGEAPAGRAEGAA